VVAGLWLGRWGLCDRGRPSSRFSPVGHWGCRFGRQLRAGRCRVVLCVGGDAGCVDAGGSSGPGDGCRGDRGGMCAGLRRLRGARFGDGWSVGLHPVAEHAGHRRSVDVGRSSRCCPSSSGRVGDGTDCLVSIGFYASGAHGRWLDRDRAGDLAASVATAGNGGVEFGNCRLPIRVGSVTAGTGDAARWLRSSREWMASPIPRGRTQLRPWLRLELWPAAEVVISRYSRGTGRRSV